MDDAKLEALNAIGLKGAMPASLADRGVDIGVVSGLLDDGLVREDRIDHGAAGPTPLAVVVMMLTAAGAEAIGEDPARIGLA